MKKMRIPVTNEASLALLFLHLGILTSIRDGKVQLGEMQSFLYSPYSVRYMGKKGIDSRIIEQITKATELEDLLSLIPARYPDALQKHIEETETLIESFGSVAPKRRFFEVFRGWDIGPQGTPR